MGEYWVYENSARKRARIHKGDCPRCNNGKGTHPGSSNRNGTWHGPYADRGEAFRKAKALDRDSARGCNVCSP